MPIVVVCPCGAKLKAPDAAAGKRVKCPKCASPLAVPAVEADFEVIDDDPPPVATPAKKKPMLVDDDDDDAPRPAKRSKPAPVEVNEAVDDDDEVEDEAPKKKRRREDDDEEDAPKKKGKKGKGKKEQAKSKLPLILGIGGGVFVLLTVVGIIVGVVMSGGGPAKGTAQAPPTKPALPPGWSEFKGEGFSVAVPDSPPFKQQEQANPGGPGGPQMAAPKMYSNGVQPQPGQAGQPAWAYQVVVFSIPDKEWGEVQQDPDKVWLQWKTLASLGGGKVEMTTYSFGGVEGREMAVTNEKQKQYGIVRILLKDKKMFMWGGQGQSPVSADDPNLKPFFDTFKVD